MSKKVAVQNLKKGDKFKDWNGWGTVHSLIIREPKSFPSDKTVIVHCGPGHMPHEFPYGQEVDVQ